MGLFCILQDNTQVQSTRGSALCQPIMHCDRCQRDLALGPADKAQRTGRAAQRTDPAAYAAYPVHGSHIVDRLMSQGHEVTVIDNMSTGFPQYVQHHSGNPNFKLMEFDLKDLPKVKEAFEGQDAVFHLAANADVRGGLDDNFRDLERNVLVTHNVLEAMRASDISKLLFSSTAAAYGEPDVFPTRYGNRRVSVFGLAGG